MQSQAVQFQAVIVPHRSLGPAGLRWLAGGLCLLGAGLSAGLWWAGAWPAMGFAGAETLLAVALLRWHARTATGSEMVLLAGDDLHIVRTGRAGRSERRLQAAWLRAVLQERPGRAPGLLLQDGIHSIEIAASLGEAEKRDLAAALQRILHQRRNPVFDNPQLRA